MSDPRAMLARMVAIGVYLVTDRAASRGRSEEEVIEAALAGGVGAVQLRLKGVTGRERYEVARRVLPLCRRAGIPLFIDDDAAVAMAIGADGVHVGQEDLPAPIVRGLVDRTMLVGVTAAAPALAREAQAAGADYVGVGAMFPTRTKDQTLETGLAGLARVRSAVTLPIVAIGGIDAGNAGSVIQAGADVVAVVRAIVAADDVRDATRRLVDGVARARGRV